ncbi:MAG: hypothetical protein RLZZ89_159 [Cyanobacteriota bacterium]|jgi:hypothetical protein
MHEPEPLIDQQDWAVLGAIDLFLRNIYGLELIPNGDGTWRLLTDLVLLSTTAIAC